MKTRVERAILEQRADGTVVYGRGWVVFDDQGYCLHDHHDEAMICATTSSYPELEVTA